jgi:hypothetical protein
MPVMMALRLPSGRTVYESHPSVPGIGTSIKCSGEYWNVAEVVLAGPDGVVSRLEPATDDFEQLLSRT